MLKGYRTLIFNGLMALILGYKVLAPEAEVPTEQEVGGFLDQVIEYWDLLVATIGNIFLRFKTTTAVMRPS